MRIYFNPLFLLAIGVSGLRPAHGNPIDFNNRTDGLYSPTMLAQDFNDPPWNNGVTQGRAGIVSGVDA